MATKQMRLMLVLAPVLGAVITPAAPAATRERLMPNSSRAMARLDGNVARFTAQAGATASRPEPDLTRAGDLLHLDARGRVARPPFGPSGSFGGVAGFGWR